MGGALKNIFNQPDLDDEQIAMADEMGLSPLIALLQHEHITVRSLAQNVIRNLRRNHNGEVGLYEFKEYNPLLELTTLKNAQAQRHGVSGLAVISGNIDCHEAIIDAFGWRTLISFCRAKSPEVQRAAANILGNLALNDEYQAEIIKQGGLTQLIKMSHTESLKVQRSVAYALANLAIEG